VPYEKNDLFIGRVELLQKLHDMLREDAKPYNHRVALYGMGGVGKTQTAVAYVYAHKADYDRIYWITAATEASLLAGFEDIATRTGCAKQTGYSDLKSLAKIVLAWLEEQQESWLVVIDNLDHIKVIEGFLPERALGKHTLITTRNPHAHGIPARGLEVPLPGMSEGLEMLYKLSGLESDFQTAEAENVVRELDKLPLAIEQAGSYVREVKRSFVGFLDDYYTRRKDLHKWQPSGNRQYEKSVATTWSISFEYIKRQNPLATSLFQFLSFLNPDRTLIAFVKAGKGALEDGLRELVSDDLKLSQALLSLEKLSLLKWSRGTDLTEVVSIHRLLQAVVKDEMTEENLRSNMASVVNMCKIVFPAEVTNETRSQCRHYQDQVIGPLLNTTKLGTEETAVVIRNVGIFLFEDGKYKDSLEFLSHTVDILSNVLGSDNENTLRSIGDLAEAYREQGRWNDAAKLQERRLATSRTVFGEDHPVTVHSIHRLSITFWNQGRLDDAAALQEKTVTAQRKLFGEDHPDTLQSMNNLALTYRDQGRFDEAAALLEKILAKRMKLLGEDQPETLKSMNNLAITYQDQGDFDDAAALQKKTLATERNLFGEDHPETLKSINNLALTYQDQGKFDDAAALQEKTLATRRKLLGEDHPLTLRSMNNLGNLYRDLERQDEAVDLQLKALSMRQQLLGKKHPDTLWSMFGLAVTYQSKGWLNDAIQLQEKTLKARKAAIGEQHPHTLETEKSLQAMLQQKHEIEEAAAATATATDNVEESETVPAEHKNKLGDEPNRSLELIPA
jgi:tetratricopeptide (TPR) repeat protein